MADDQGSKTTSIDNLINELPKQKSFQPAPFSPKPVSPPAVSQSNPPVALPPPVERARPIMPSSVPDSVSKPVMPPPFIPKPASQATQTVPPPIQPAERPKPVPAPAPAKEYQSSIRTMSEDISSLKTGQKPSGVNIPRTIEPLKPAVPAPILPKPPVQPSTPGMQVKLGETQKTGPMAQAKIPTPAPMPKKAEAPQIIIPEGGKKMVGGNLLYIGISLAVVLAGAAYWFFVIRTPAVPVAEETPMPTATATPAATLNQLLSNAVPIEIDLSVSADPTTDFNEAITAQTVSGGTFDKLNIKINAEGAIPALTDIMDKFLVAYPAELKTNLGAESAVLLYGQKEVFTAKGLPDTSAINIKKLILVTEVNEPAMAASISKEWESAMADEFKNLFELDVKKAASKAFLNSLYGETDINYINFAYPDKTVDYAIVAASNGKNYLVIAGSREAMYEIIDILR
ncbi:MAG: hypothetical protein UU83_C0015G0001 [Candidatus Jorgensenbacteria bacterium GW2011_GWF2_41_8]|uniref:Uncharacterized protein n=3 Tax=Parcubacteria group TaxID=1794811 RepID=A0A0G1AHZ6_9BACT|nr:MAG: hypothetical protein UU83_C0015G0001 [Candidatus Jorgensenbacteria bacterium GW2011_GWF2_41_8]